MREPGAASAKEGIVREFGDAVRSLLGMRLKEMWLFGSRARGDSHPHSDYDVLIVADGEKAELRELVAATENEVLLRSGELFASIIYTTDEWQWAQSAPLGINVQREGKRIA